MLQKKSKDYLEKMHALFPDIEEASIDHIIEYGLKKMHFYLKKGVDVWMKDAEGGIFIGDSRKTHQVAKSYVKEHEKYRRMFVDKKQPWDEYHYFGLTEEENEKFKQHPIKVSLYKLMKESAIGPNLRYIYRVKTKYTVPPEKIPWREDIEITFSEAELSEDGMNKLKGKKYKIQKNEKN